MIFIYGDNNGRFSFLIFPLFLNYVFSRLNFLPQGILKEGSRSKPICYIYVQDEHYHYQTSFSLHKSRWQSTPRLPSIPIISAFKCDVIFDRELCLKVLKEALLLLFLFLLEAWNHEQKMFL